MIRAIACVGKNLELGKNNGLIFNIKEDMKFFRDTTLKTIVVCGENTLLSFPESKPLKNRVTIVLCREGHEYNDCICIHDLNQLIIAVKLLAKQYDVYIIGGGMMYKTMLPYCSELLLTEVEATDSEATVFFPEYKNDFSLVSATDYKEENEIKFRFATYKK